ncbi:hypothetical protein NB646_08800 [Oxalobacter aliiformigenes]|uniref:Uncharacterized protein n=2 Tax=Oxalobacter aliiformigenes TaxID=2946593 RepID=A0A9E9LIY2_9BURK|nr:hypothetical protein [Oxalobacter aliiformigenes]WAV90916.1 hypothetical protein NB646_08800 [Oxalobacter aliiformigenes]WAV95511.1 hypothetical protein NB643_01725 [Oxalobacter aliiformigenes]
METWMILASVVMATVIVFLLGVFQRWFRKSRIVHEVRTGVQSAQTFREKYPTPEKYEVDIIRELLVQGAEESLLKQVLKETYDTTIAQSHRSGEEPAHFVDRWLYSIAAPKRWDFIEGVLPYYFRLVQLLLEEGLRPTPVIKNCGGMPAFIQIVESEFSRGTSPEELVSKHFGA